MCSRLSVIAFAVFLVHCPQIRASGLPQGPGLAAAYSGDSGIASDTAVVFSEDFEESDLQAVFDRWNDVLNKDHKPIAFSTDHPAGSAGSKSLQITATRGLNDGGHLFRLLDRGYDRLFVRFYTRFTADHGFLHHFVRVRASLDPYPYPVGMLDKSPSLRACGTDIEPLDGRWQSGQWFSPPGAWYLSAYWPDMKSWQGEGGTSFYPDPFLQPQPSPTARDEWVCVEVMVKMNSSDSSYDGEEAFWINGRLINRIGTGLVSGYWNRDKYMQDPAKGTPFQGFRWRQDMNLQWNRLWLDYYVSEEAFQKSSEYARLNPSAVIDTLASTVRFDNVVVATSYIGPLGPVGSGMLVPGDYNADGRLSVSDVAGWVRRRLQSPEDRALDVNRDGKVNMLDALALLLKMA